MNFHNYELVEKVYRDSRSQISRAVCKLDGSKVLIKTINLEQDKAKEWLQKELAILNRLDAKSIIKVDKAKTKIDKSLLVLEDFHSQSFGRFLQKQSVSVPTFLTLAIQLVSALKEIHCQGIIHCNIQPDCILINADLELKIVDFFSAVELTSDKTSSQEAAFKKLSELNIAYIAPEQTGRMNLAIDCRTDFYALGVLLYRLATNVLPYNAQNSLELIHCHLAQKPPAPNHLDKSIPPAVSSIIMKLLAKDPNDRYQTEEALKADLRFCQKQYSKQPTIEQFELGVLDSCSKFAIPNKLYGRSLSVAEITKSIATARVEHADSSSAFPLTKIGSGAAHMLLLSGTSGIGKTALVKQVVPTIIGNRGYFATGSFEPLSSTVTPYKAITQALRELIQGLLKETSDCRQSWRQKIQQAIANNGKVITNILPELELIIGSQADLPEVSRQESQHRFDTVLIRLLQVFTADSKSPLILFLDNLQWADSASLNLLELLLSTVENQHLLIIGAYRDDEIDREHPLTETIARLAQTVKINCIALQPLNSSQINNLLVDTFYCAPKRSLGLAQLLLGRTNGNPFFVARLLQSFYQEQLISFNYHTFSWQWCIDKILTTTITNYDVIELVGQNLRQLPPLCQQILKLAACIGNQFDLLELSNLWNETQHEDFTTFDPQSIAEILDDALKAGIVIFEHQASLTDYKFLHYRIYQIIYSSIDRAELSQLHLIIGQSLLRTSPKEIELNIFEIVHHLNIARMGAKESLDRDYLVELNLTASQKARNASAYEVAASYSNVALELLPISAWQDNYCLMLATYQEAIKIQSLQQNLIYAEQLCNIVLTQAETVLDLILVYKIKIQTHIAQNQMQLAVDIGLYVLNLLDIDLSDATEAANVRPLELDSRKIESYRDLPIMSDRFKLAAMEIMITIIPPVYIVKPQLLSVIASKAIAISLQYGNCPLSAHAYALYGILLCSDRNIEAGYQLGKLALDLQQKFDAKEIKSKIGFLFNNMIRHWREPAVSTLDHFLKGIEDGMEVGDIEHACFHSTRYCAHLFYVGEPLSAACEKSLKQIEFIRGLRQDFQLNYALMWHQLNLNLQGFAPNKFLLIGDSFDETKSLNSWLETNNNMSLFSFYLIKLILCYLFGDYQQAVVYARRGKQYLGASVGLMGFGVYHFYYALAMLATSCQDKSKYFSEILSCQSKISYWSNHAPDNYLHRHELIAAEIAKILGKHEQAAEHYDQAITEAGKAGFLHESALAEELAGEFYLWRRKNKIASYYLNDAYKSYRRWGALAKVRQLEFKHAHLLNLVDELEWADNSDRSIKKADGEEFGSERVNLDLFSIIKASQAISSEIILDNLLSKMMAIVMENAGAQKSFLLLERNSRWVVAAFGSMESSQRVALPYIPIDEYDHLPRLIVNYVQNTGETVMLDRASQSGIFIDDPYVIEHQPKSILCCPMSHQNKLQGILYLENSSIEGAFTPQKLTVLQALLSQVSISIVNARLYKDLEDHASVQKSLRQKEILLKEIHHRVKNNLLVVSSLLEFQSSYIEDPDVCKLLENCQNRIATMAIVHQHLYGSSQLDRIDLAEYIQSLLDNIAYSQGSQERNINLVLDLEPIELNIESANPCGLIINELISNAFEHGFSDRQSGNIWIRLKRNLDDQIVLSIEDDGVGFGTERNLQNNDSLGLELVCTLVEQINGQITLDKSVGTKIEIVFNELDYQSRI